MMTDKQLESVARAILNWAQSEKAIYLAFIEDDAEYERAYAEGAAKAALAALEGDLRDAGRYRHVRAKPHMLLHLSNKDFDAAIDAAMAGDE